METHALEKKRLSRLLLPVLALVLSGLLLTGFIQTVSVQAAALPEGTIPSDLNSSQKPEESVISDLFAPQQQTVAQLGIVKTKNPQIFSSVTTNTYIINITELDQNPGVAGFSVEDTLPTGMTWTPVPAIGNWDCSGSTLTKVSCLYTQNITTTQLIEPIIFDVIVPTSMAGTFVNTASLYYGNPVIQKSSSVSTIVANGSDLALEKEQTPAIVPTDNTPITYTLTVANNGPDNSDWNCRD